MSNQYILISSDLHSFSNFEAQKYMKRMIYGRFNKIELCKA